VLLRGKDLKYWAGHYGAKFACAQLSFIGREDLPAFGGAASREFWAGRRIAQSVEGIFGWGQQGQGQQGDEGSEEEEEEEEEQEEEEQEEEEEQAV
jgi:hypothetical protein